jgi:hypothetical protein
MAKKKRKMTPYLATGIAEGFKEPQNKEEVKDAWQYLVDTGLAWRLRGWFGRTAQRLLDAGRLQYPKKRTYDFYGNPIPTSSEMKKKKG